MRAEDRGPDQGSSARRFFAWPVVVQRVAQPQSESGSFGGNVVHVQPNRGRFQLPTSGSKDRVATVESSHAN